VIKELGVSAKDAKSVTFYQGSGCESCKFTGSKGRTAIYEIMVMDEEIRRLILERASSDQIKTKAISMGMRTLRKDGWEKIKKGQPLFTIYAPDLVATQQEYLLALENQRKLQNTAFAEIDQGASNLLAASRQRLEYWDISEKQIEQLEQTGKVSKTLTIYSPATGVVIHKNALEGIYVKAGTDQFRIGDLSTIWVYVHIFEYELPWIQVGQEAEMELPYFPGKKYTGRVDYIYPYLDKKTRDVKLRLVFDNPDLELRPQMYANIRIESRVDDDALVIPSEAIIRTGVRNVVFIALDGGKFMPRDIEIGAEGEDAMINVLSGLREGETVVTSAQFLLDSESRLREAIQKMLEVKKGKTSSQETEEQMPPKEH